LTPLAARLKTLAAHRRISIGTAESCTGGLVGHAVTAIPGSSAYYRGGVISYADELKAGLLDVPTDLLRRHGAVSAQVAIAMAEGARARLGCDLAVAVTGVAGPDGGTDAKPVGLTYVATAGAHGSEVRRQVWSGDRAANKVHSAALALEMLIAALGPIGDPDAHASGTPEGEVAASSSDSPLSSDSSLSSGSPLSFGSPAGGHSAPPSPRA
jgi:PncC family amidohydrolase